MAAMLHLYESNRLEALAIVLANTLNDPPLADPFRPETVIVQSQGMGRWLTLELARHTGIAAHLDYVLPASFAWRLMREVLGHLPERSRFAPEIMSWRLMAMLPGLTEPPFEPLQRYLEGGEAAAFELAGKVADVFDQYLVFRPDWIRAWEAGEQLGLGPDEAWQAALWQRLAQQDPGTHRVRLFDHLLARLGSARLPERISVFGIASLAPMYLHLLQRLAAHTEVGVFLLNPSREYWGNIVDARGQLKLFQGGLEEDEALPDHPLLASLGKQGRDFFDQVAEELPHTHPFFIEPGHDRLLARLQRDILDLSSPASRACPLAQDDGSIEIHATHGPMRELEVLKDRLLALFADDSTLTPADVAVLTPDINAYAPYVDAVFGQREDAPNVPYSIADRRVEREEPLLTTFSAVLALADSRFAADAVLGLLDCPALLARFNLAETDVPFIHAWVREAGIRWGRDARHKATLGLPGDARFTWRWGLDRLLLGTVLPAGMAGQGSPLFGTLMPAGGADGQMADILARFAALFATLERLADTWAEPASPRAWGERFIEAADALFWVDDAGEAALDVIRRAAVCLTEDTALAGFNAPVPLAVARDWFDCRLASASSAGFLTGGVTFCAMVPMRSIPFRVICLIGMNDGAYPRDERPVSFDLVARHPRRGDRSRRFDDRYLFLEALLSARERLYLSYVGLSARTNEPLPPSPLVSELIDTLHLMTHTADAPLSREALVARLVTRHPLQPFSPECYRADLPGGASFEPSYATALASGPVQPRPFGQPLEDLALPEVVHLSDFVRFWRNPVRAWLRDRLGLRLSDSEEDVPVREPFALAGESRFAVRQPVLEAILTRRPMAAVRAQLAAEGVIPPAELGTAWLEDEERRVRQWAVVLPPELATPALPPQPVRLDVAGLTLAGALNDLRPGGLMRALPRRARAGELIDLWLSHLVLCAVRPAGVDPVSRYFSEDLILHLQPVEDPLSLLAPWAEAWQAGQRAPLPFFARTSLAWARAWTREPEAPAAALAAALKEWAPSFSGNGKVPQRDEPAIALAFRHADPLADPAFAELARSLLVPLAERIEIARPGDEA